MPPKTDPYATKLHKRVDVLLILFIVIIVALLLRPGAKGKPEHHSVVPSARHPFWSTFAMFTPVQIPDAPYRLNSSNAPASSAAGLSLQPGTNFAPLVFTEDPDTPTTVASALDQDQSAQPYSAPALPVGAGSVPVEAHSLDAGSNLVGTEVFASGSGNSQAQTNSSSSINGAVESASRYGRNDHDGFAPDITKSTSASLTTSAAPPAESIATAPVASAPATFTDKTPSSSAPKTIQINPDQILSAGIFKDYVVVDRGVSGNEFFQLHGGTGTSFGGLNLGTFSASTGTLTLNGYELNTFQNGGDDIQSAFGDYRITKQGNTAGSFTENTVLFNSNGQNFGDKKWQTTGQGTNLFAGPLDVGTYNFEVYTRAHGVNGGFNFDIFSNNGGANYVATFTVGISDFTYSGASGGTTASGTGWTNGRQPGNGHNLFFASTGTTALTNALSSVNSLTFNSGAGAFTISSGALSVAAGITNNSSNLETINTNITSSASQSFAATSGGLAFGGTTTISSGTLTVTGSNNTTFSGIVTGTGSFVKNGSGTAFLNGSYSSNGYTGATTVNAGTLRAGVGSLVQTSSVTVNSGGTLLLSSNGRHIGTNTSVNMNGGTFNTGGFSEPNGGPTGLTTSAIGALTLTATSTIDFGAGSSSILEFGGLGTHTANTVLQIIDWDGVPGTGGSGDRLLFIGLATSFATSYSQSDISFNGMSGYTTVQFDPFGTPYFEVVGLTPVPEPSTWLAAALALSAIAWTQRRRFTLVRATFSAKQG